jgi:hypothetical protein
MTLRKQTNARVKTNVSKLIQSCIPRRKRNVLRGDGPISEAQIPSVHGNASVEVWAGILVVARARDPSAGRCRQRSAFLSTSASSSVSERTWLQIEVQSSRIQWMETSDFHMYAHTHSLASIYIYTHAHTYKHTHIHTDTHTQKKQYF